MSGMGIAERWEIGSRGARVVHRYERLVQVDVQQQLTSGGTHVIGLDRKVLPNPSLDPKVVLINVGIAQIWILRTNAHQATGRQPRALLPVIRNQRNILVITRRPGELARLRYERRLVRGQAVGCVQAHVRGNVVEHFVITHAESCPDHRVVLPEEGLGESGRIRDSDHRSHIVLIGIHAAIGEREWALRGV